MMDATPQKLQHPNEKGEKTPQKERFVEEGNSEDSDSDDSHTSEIDHNLKEGIGQQLKSQTPSHTASTTTTTFTSHSITTLIRQRTLDLKAQSSSSNSGPNDHILPPGSSSQFLSSTRTGKKDIHFAGAVRRVAHFVLNYLWSIMLLFATIIVFTVFIRANLEDEHLGNASKNVTSQAPGIGWLRGQEQLKHSLVRLKAKYPSQNAWIQIYSAISSTMTEETPKQPSAIVFLTPPSVGIESFASCLSREIAKNTHSIFYNITGLQHTQKIRELSAEYFNSRATVTDIHDDLKTYLNNGKVLIVKDIEKINRQDHLFVFHAFCDNSAAPDKRATFIFIIPVPRNIYSQYDWNEDQGAEISQQILSSAWTSVSPDKRPALIARVAANIVMIQEGDFCEENDN